MDFTIDIDTGGSFTDGFVTAYHEVASSQQVAFKATQFVSEDLFVNGDVLERDPELVMDDVRKQITSPWAAENVYRVAFDAETLDVNHPETEKLRSLERQRRKDQGKPFHDFIGEWLQRKPRDEIIRSYGPWPEGIK